MEPPELSEQGPSTLRARCEILERQKAFVAESLAEMQQTYEKVSCKLEYFSGLCEEYEQGALKQSNTPQE
ncbi:hypothetical protein [Lachnoclostridium sp. Marseille-P6806]|uniref:hypothetical protein n=1 Tax=Lachnoclostridium sp. Marseille-P6806 TaxID=2364793 RepID=UPI00102F7E0D|nr:hypothetical protein [Lachnoclostridium sp. Marseille-P6806]